MVSGEPLIHTDPRVAAVGVGNQKQPASLSTWAAEGQRQVSS